MTRRKLSEYRSKVLVTTALGLTYEGWTVDSDHPDYLERLAAIAGHQAYVIKVDQGVKGRFKKGLVTLGVASDKLKSCVESLRAKGYSKFIIEPQIEHLDSAERYLALSYDQAGTYLSYSASGGVDIESHAASIHTVRLDDVTDWSELSEATGLATDQLKKLWRIFSDQYMTMLEINPYVLDGDKVELLDLAIEVDDAGGYFTNSWSEDDFREASSMARSEEERIVRALDEKSPASLKLQMINPDGAVFLLLSGGGASVVVADEVCNRGYGTQLANYGEYSGNPNAEETYIYTRSVLQLLLASAAKKKVLFIGGAVANFTDVASTFTGIIRAIDELADELHSQGVRIFVRRGGPGQEQGLAHISRALSAHGLLGAVHDPSTPLTSAIAEALEGMPK